MPNTDTATDDEDVRKQIAEHIQAIQENNDKSLKILEMIKEEISKKNAAEPS